MRRRDIPVVPVTEVEFAIAGLVLAMSSGGHAKDDMQTRSARHDWWSLAFELATSGVLFVLAIAPSCAQTPSAEEARLIEFGKEIYKNKANCQSCHKWDGSGDQGYGGIALPLRKTALTPEQLTEVVKCGRPLTGMPYFDQFAYTDKRCFDMTREDLGKDMPPLGEPLQPREISAVVKYIFAKVVGRGPATYEDCVDFWGKDTRQCEPMKK